MSKLPRVSGQEVVAALTRLAFGQTVVPNHREIDTGTLRAIIRQVGISVDEFNKLL